PAPERLDGQREAVRLSELLEREGGTKIGVAFADERERPVARGVRQPAITRAPAPARRQAGRPGTPERAVEAPDLPLAEPEQRRRPAPGEAPLRQLGHDLQSIQFPHRQRHRLRHGATVGPGRTFLLWGNRTFAFGAYNSASDKYRLRQLGPLWGLCPMPDSAGSHQAGGFLLARDRDRRIGKLHDAVVDFPVPEHHEVERVVLVELPGPLGA